MAIAAAQEKALPAQSAVARHEAVGYRADIDGLRALAVLPVLFYHAGVRGFSGGFVGVDVFFVISGYLITGILLRDVAAGRHSIAGFYKRRILRIFPALFAMMAVVTALACVTMLPSELLRFARSLGSAALFASNVQFYLEAGYFDLGSAVKPLLHTWSLAIEEQWYIVWPLVVAAMAAPGLGRLRTLTALMVVLSLGTSIWLTGVDAGAAFYLLPSRAWELGVGALLAIVARRTTSRFVLECCGVVGVTLILASVKLYTHETPFPGWAALAPCVGAALLIYSGASGTLAGRVLSLRPFQFIGKISYSLYLWHWPVIVFAEVGLFLPKTPPVIGAEIAASILLATASWYWIERPFRSGMFRRTAPVLAAAAAVIGMAVLAAFAVRPLAQRLMDFSETQMAWARVADLDGDALYRRGVCFSVGGSAFDAARCLTPASDRLPTVMVVGDSHAAALWPGLSRWTDRVNVLQATGAGCAARLPGRTDTGPCDSVMNSALREGIVRRPPDVLVIASRWKPRSLEGLPSLLADPAVRRANPVLVGPIPEYTAALPRLMVFADRRRDAGLIERSRDPGVVEIDRLMRDIAKNAGVPYISLVDALCPGTRQTQCRVSTPAGVPLQFDYGHLTAEGSGWLVDAVMPTIMSQMRRP
ncbi:MAG: acyltransferase [Burkholderiales bacterium]|nr:MAG: acyltransferase [Burkholderiales bacterium]